MALFPRARGSRAPPACSSGLAQQDRNPKKICQVLRYHKEIFGRWEQAVEKSWSRRRKRGARREYGSCGCQPGVPLRRERVERACTDRGGDAWRVARRMGTYRDQRLPEASLPTRQNPVPAPKQVCALAPCQHTDEPIPARPLAHPPARNPRAPLGTRARHIHGPAPSYRPESGRARGLAGPGGGWFIRVLTRGEGACTHSPSPGLTSMCKCPQPNGQRASATWAR